MKYLIGTNKGDFIFNKKRTATTWLKELHSKQPKITCLWVYDHTGMWIDAASINEEGKITRENIYPDGALRVWVIWACRIFKDGDHCKDYQEAYYLSLQLDKVEDKERCNQGGYIWDYEAFVKAAKDCYTF